MGMEWGSRDYKMDTETESTDVPAAPAEQPIFTSRFGWGVSED